MKKIIIAGGTGFLGKCLVDFYKNKAEDIVILSRRLSIMENARIVTWDAENRGDWTDEMEGADAVINLCGKSVDCRYHEKNKAKIYSSRLLPTRAIGEAISKCKNPPKVWINASSATIYRHSIDQPMDELTGEIGIGFSVDVCQKWEAAFHAFDLPKTRMAIARIAIVLGKSGGALTPLLRMTKLGLGGAQGPGNQMMSWLHEKDFARMVDFMIKENLEGAYNLSAPNPVTNREFMKAIRDTVGIKMGLPTPSWLLGIGARIIQTETELILKSRYVVPGKLLEAGYQHRFPHIDHALKSLI